MSDRHAEGEDPLLVCVDAVVRSSALVGLPSEITCAIDALLDHSDKWTLETASAAGLAHLLDRLARREWPGVGSVFRRARYRKNVRAAASSGHLQVLQWWLTSYLQSPEEPDYRTIFELAVEHGRLPVLRWLKGRNALPSADEDTAPVVCEHPHVVYWLHEQQSAYPLVVFLAQPAKDGDLAFIQWVHAREDQFAEVKRWPVVVYWAALKHHMEIIRWIYLHRPYDFTEGALLGAMEGGHLDIAQWLSANGLVFDLEAIRPSLLKIVDLPMAQWVIRECESLPSSERNRWMDFAVQNAARCGNLEALKLLCAQYETPQNLFTLMQIAAEAGHLNIVQWLHSQGAFCSYAFMDTAATHGHLAIVQWLYAERSEGYADYSMTGAVANGHLHVVEWLHRYQAGRLDANVMHQAAFCGRLEIVKYVCKHGDPDEFWTGKEMQDAAWSGHLEIVQWLNEHGFGGDVNADYAAINGHFEVVKYLALHCNSRCTLTGATFAARAGFFALLEWLMQQGIMESHKLVQVLGE